MLNLSLLNVQLPAEGSEAVDKGVQAAVTPGAAVQPAADTTTCSNAGDTR